MTAATLPDNAARDFEVIALVGFVHGVSHFFHLLLPSLFPWLIHDFGLGYTEVGMTVTAFFVVSGSGQAFAGFLVDRFGAARMLAIGMASFAIAALILASAQHYAALIVGGLVAGFGNCVFHPADFTVLNRRVRSARLGHAFSAHGLSGNLGWAAAPLFITAVSGHRRLALGRPLLPPAWRWSRWGCCCCFVRGWMPRPNRPPHNSTGAASPLGLPAFARGVDVLPVLPADQHRLRRDAELLGAGPAPALRHLAGHGGQCAVGLHAGWRGAASSPAASSPATPPANAWSPERWPSPRCWRWCWPPATCPTGACCR
jgi:MFS family permease